MMNRRVVVTGIGAVSALGNGVQENWDSLLRGASKPVENDSLKNPFFSSTAAGKVRNFEPAAYNIKPKSLKVMNKTIQYCLAASQLAVSDAGIDKGFYQPREMGVSLGIDGIQFSAEELLLASYEAVGKDMNNYISPEHEFSEMPIRLKDPERCINPLWSLSVLCNMSLCHVSISQNFQGHNMTFSSVDTAGSQAIGEAFNAIKYGNCNMFAAGGAYGLNSLHLMSMSFLNILSSKNRMCRSFSIDRDGSAPGEGAAMLVLEEESHAAKRGARIYAEITGYGSSFNCNAKSGVVKNDSFTAASFSKCIEKALTNAGIFPSDIDYINADGKATIESDIAEADAIRKIFKTDAKKIPVSSSKPMTGHMLPASGAFEAFSTVMSLYRGEIPPVLKEMESDESLGLNIVSEKPLKKELTYAISNNFGFMGENTVLVFKKYLEK